MSNDNLILFPEKSKSTISMSQSEAKWMLAGSLLVVLTIAIGVNSALFSAGQRTTTAVVGEPTQSRSIASINPIFKVSWEKKAFEVLDKTQSRELSSIGQPPSAFDSFAFGQLEGKYQVRKVDGKITEIRFSEGMEDRPKVLSERQEFLSSHLNLFSDKATEVRKFHQEDNSERLLEKYELLSKQGEVLGTVQILLDQNQNLLSMTVQ